jgi:hypothetical protein
MRRLLVLFCVLTIAVLTGSIALASDEGIFLNNDDNGNGGWYSGSPSGLFLSPTTTTDGAFWKKVGTNAPVLGAEDFYMEVYAQATNGSWLPFPANPIPAAASAPLWGSSYAGYFERNTSNWLPDGTLASNLDGYRHLEIKAWMGSYANYAAAYADGGYVADITFWNPTAAMPGIPPSLTQMPAMVFAVPVPEPSTIALVAAAAVGALGYCWRKRK